MLTFDIAGGQIDGARDYQEDAYLVTRLGDSNSKKNGSLIIVADGMGGHAAGNVASNMAVQTFNKHLTSNYPSTELPKILRQAVLQANNSIAETVRETAALKGMGCTLVAAVIDDKFVRWVSVGDSHLYVARGTELHKKNADHSYGGFLARMAAQGKSIEPEPGFSRNMLMSALTGDEIAEIDCPDTPFELQPGDRLIIASDGLDTLGTGKLLGLLVKANSAKDCADAILKGVQDARMPRQDNTTVVVVVVGEQAEFKARPAPPPMAVNESAPKPASMSMATPSRPLGRTPQPQPVVLPPRKKPQGNLAILLVPAFLLIGVITAMWLTFQKSEVETPPLMDDSAAVAPPQVNPPVAPQDSPATPPAPPAPAATTPANPAPNAAISTGAVAVAGAGKVFTDGPGPEMVFIPAGRFTMGASDAEDVYAERPAHEVEIKRFAISTHEVTAGEFARFAGRQAGNGRLPAAFVSWNQALAYTRWLSAQTGKRYRLPSEAEWEYAARAGTTTPYWWGRPLGENNAHCFACESGLDPRKTTQVGRFKPNAFGLYDTAGNVEEWVHDCFHASYQGAPNDGSVFEGGDCPNRVARGGAFSSGPQGLRVTARNKFPQSSANDGLGFRVVREP